ncbi:glycosyltransferase family 39 protein [Amycolatopsis sp. WAC 01376]|uniref:glycosyltransferase family 39 protein n=1 Tax=Amycolatopsis sp. WAC 01376 TaxID=2203195 RepID=UPI001F3931F4|nr:glycosyltransferase family 39 protein [Amycolatopsis sp. WAC 01376]
MLTLVSGRYGFHRDELYFLAAGKRLAWGYVDQPSLTPFLARISTDVFGATPSGLRVAATLCATATVVLLALVASGLIWQAVHGFPLLTVASGISADDGAENRILFVPMQLLYLPRGRAGLDRRRPPTLARSGLALGSFAGLGLSGVVRNLGGTGRKTVLLSTVSVTARGRRRLLDRTWRRALAVALAFVGAAVSLVVGLPLLPVSALAPVLVVNKEQGEQAGWPELASTVTRIPVEQRSTAVIFTRNYGQAGALEYYGLPAVHSGHMSYADWGPPPAEAVGPVVVVGPYLPAWFIGCREAAVHDNGLGMGNAEQGVRISLCAGTSRPWSALWGELRHYY